MNGVDNGASVCLFMWGFIIVGVLALIVRSVLDERSIAKMKKLDT